MSNSPTTPFNSIYSIYSHGFVRSVVCVPHLRVADPVYNTDRTLDLARQASAMHAREAPLFAHDHSHHPDCACHTNRLYQ